MQGIELKISCGCLLCRFLDLDFYLTIDSDEVHPSM